MGGFDRRKQQSFTLVATIGAVVIIINLLLISGTDVRSRIGSIPIPIPGKSKEVQSLPDPNVRESWLRYPSAVAQMLIMENTAAKTTLVAPRQWEL